MKDFLKGFLIVALAGGLLIGIIFISPLLLSQTRMRAAPKRSEGRAQNPAPIRQQTKEELIAEAMRRSRDIRALYMTADVANDPGRGATGLRDYIIHLAETTEINGIVIDVKEVCGPDYNETRLKKLLQELRQKKIWAIARIVSFKDASQREIHPDWYLGRASVKKSPDGCAVKYSLTARGSALKESGKILWQDNKGGYWMDPMSPGAREYIVAIGKKMIDLKFDELQFDYVRFPSDGDVSRATYPSWDGKIPKYAVMKSFFEFLNTQLKSYQPDIILSADLFGYVASQGGDDTIGQRLEDIRDNFDYVSFMVYPSHYYNGLILPPDAKNALPAVNFNLVQARTHPDVVVGRSVLSARNFLEGNATTSAATSSTITARSHAHVRPWLEDFFHEQDRRAGRPYGTQKVRLQIDAAEKNAGYGWLLWNASNIYSTEALKKDTP